MFTEEQNEILKNSNISLSSLNENEVFFIAERKIELDELTDEQLVEFLNIANATYRGGTKIINDSDYDFVFLVELKNRHPNHPFISTVESENAFTGKTLQLPQRMLSTDKAYTKKQIIKWLNRIEKSANELQLKTDDLIIQVTPKLDGFAAYDDGEKLYTRGDGRRGTDVSRVFDRGLKVAGNGKRGQGAGEIVIDKNYFKRFLSDHFDNTRNVQASILAEKTFNNDIQKAIKSGAAVFYPFSQLPSWEGFINSLLDEFDNIVKTIRDKVDYDVDGVILEVTEETIKKHMGSTRHHHKWQIAYKANFETANVKVIQVTPQTSRSGRVNPVVNIEPTKLSGATISRVTAHHYKMVKNKGIGTGAIIELVRSGLVIPKIESVITRAMPQIPKSCPSCHAILIWDNDYLICPNNIRCSAQRENIMEHYFKTLGNVEGFGPKTIEKLYENGISSVVDIYNLTELELNNFGFGTKVSKNLIEQLHRSKIVRIEDWRFLSAFGVIRLGQGNCEKLLQHYLLTDIFDLTINEIVSIEGFGEKSSNTIVEGLKSIKQDFDILYRYSFHLEITKIISNKPEGAQPRSVIDGKSVVFTGAMSGSRSEMEKQAKSLGAIVRKSVSTKTNYLIIGNDVGKNKLNDAEKHGTAILTEEGYLSLIKNDLRINTHE